MDFNREGTPHEKLKIGRVVMPLNYDEICDVEFDGINFRDAPDFSDAYIESATYLGREMTEEELERLNDDGDYVYDQLMKDIY